MMELIYRSLPPQMAHGQATQVTRSLFMKAPSSQVQRAVVVRIRRASEQDYIWFIVSRELDDEIPNSTLNRFRRLRFLNEGTLQRGEHFCYSVLDELSQHRTWAATPTGPSCVTLRGREKDAGVAGRSDRIS